MNIRYMRMSGRQRCVFWITSILLLVVAICVMLIRQLRPVITDMATARVSNTVNRIVVAAVDEALLSGNVDYQTLVNFEKDDSGRVTALKSNITEVNRLRTTICDSVSERLGEVSTSELRIPLGTLSGSTLLAGRGPTLCVKMQTVGSSIASFRNEFASAGINQTKHQILLDIDVYMSILLPGFSTYTKVSNTIAVAETVVVGNVPESYTYFSDNSQTEAELAHEYIMNNG